MRKPSAWRPKLDVAAIAKRAAAASCGALGGLLVNERKVWSRVGAVLLNSDDVACVLCLSQRAAHRGRRFCSSVATALSCHCQTASCHTPRSQHAQ